MMAKVLPGQYSLNSNKIGAELLDSSVRSKSINAREFCKLLTAPHAAKPSPASNKSVNVSK